MWYIYELTGVVTVRGFGPLWALAICSPISTPRHRSHHLRMDRVNDGLNSLTDRVKFINSIHRTSVLRFLKVSHKSLVLHDWRSPPSLVCRLLFLLRSTLHFP